MILACALGLPATAADKARDLEGVWTNAWLTTLERPASLKTLELSEAEAAAAERAHPRTPEPARGGPVGQDETEWWDMGAGLGRIGGRARSSWIVDPSDGRLPYSPAGLAALQKAQAAARRPDNPETRPAPERCLMGLGGTSLPPMLNASYSNLLQIVQGPDDVVIVPEMNVGPRIIPVRPGPDEPGAAWSGRSRGHWEGNTLVVQTTGFQPGAAWRTPTRLYISPAGRVTERFTRVGADELLYAFTVDDPATFTQPWKGEMPLRRTTAPMYEFACHEGNYSLPGILAGAREEDRAASK